MRVSLLCSIAMIVSLGTSRVESEIIFLESETQAGQFVVEAETFSSRASADDEWLIIPQESPGFPFQFANFRGTGYIQLLPDDGQGSGGPLLPPVTEYVLRIASIGTYRLFTRWDGHNDNSDTFYASITELSDGIGGAIPDWYRYVRIADDGDFATGPWFGSAGFERTDSPFSNGETPAVWNITNPGDYTLTFNMREDGTAIDTFVFQLSGLADPTEDGPPTTPIADAIFADGFESGDTSRWSLTNP